MALNQRFFDTFKVLDGELPAHIDAASQCSVLIPVENTGDIYVEDDKGRESIVYDSIQY